MGTFAMNAVSVRYKDTRVMGVGLLVAITVVSTTIIRALYRVPWEMSGYLHSAIHSFAISFVLWCAVVRQPWFHDRLIVANLLVLLPVLSFMDNWIIGQLGNFGYDGGDYGTWRWVYWVGPHLRHTLIIVAGLLFLKATGRPRFDVGATWGGQLTVSDVRGRR